MTDEQNVQKARVRGLTIPLTNVNVDLKEKEMPDGRKVKYLDIGPVVVNFQLPLSDEGASELAAMLLGTKVHIAGADMLSKLEKPT